MTTKIVFPKLAMGITDGTVVRWLKGLGDRVHKGEAIVEVETAKAIQEVEAPATGTLSRVLVGEGNVIEVNMPLGEIEESDDAKL